MDPAHRDILRNEQADREAKRGKSKSSPIDTGIGVEVRKSIIKKHVVERWREQWKTCTREEGPSFAILKEPPLKNQIKENTKTPTYRKLWRLRWDSGRKG